MGGEADQPAGGPGAELIAGGRRVPGAGPDPGAPPQVLGGTGAGAAGHTDPVGVAGVAAHEQSPGQAEAHAVAGVAETARAGEAAGAVRAGVVRVGVAAAGDRWPAAAGLGLSAALYLGLSLLLWWGVWSTHPTATTSCACGDSALFLWFIEWPAYAITHGHGLFYSASLFHPTGINLLSNTSEVAIGTVLAPVTWLFGPVATLNVALTAAPVASALAMCWLLRRWVSWAPAAFAGGLLYGFSPVVVSNLSDAHLMTGFLAVPPLVVACLDELLVRQRRRPGRVGVVLGLLLVVQFFVGTEMLVLLVALAVVGVVMVVGYALVGHRAELARRWRHAVRGLVWAGGVSVVLLAYPAWFALAGPAHLAGMVWPTVGRGADGIFVSNLLSPTYTPGWSVRSQHLFGGYQGGGLVTDYLGVGLVVVVVLGLVLWRRDRRLWLFTALGAASVLLALGLNVGGWVPWAAVARLPVLENVIQGRFLALTYLCAGVSLAVVVDRTRGSVHGLLRTFEGRWTHRRRSEDRSGSADTHGPAAQPGSADTHGPASRPGWLRWAGRLAGAGAGAVLALVALVPIGTTYAAQVPFTVQPAIVPRWFSEVAPTLPSGSVVMAYPLAFSGVQSSMAWQAIDEMHFAMAGGGSPEGIAQRAGRERAGFEVLSAASLAYGPPPTPTTAAVAAVRHAIKGWGVTVVVVPDQPELPSYEHGTNLPYAVALFTAALGRRPVYQADAWVWPGADRPSPQVAIPPDAFTACATADALATGQMAIPDCVLAGGAAGP